MPTVYCYPVKLTIADLIRAKSICSQTHFSHIIDRLLTSLVRSVLWNIRPLFFAWTSLLRRSVHAKKPRSDISQYRPHARSISRYHCSPVNTSSIADNLGSLVPRPLSPTEIKSVHRGLGTSLDPGNEVALLMGFLIKSDSFNKVVTILVPRAIFTRSLVEN